MLKVLLEFLFKVEVTGQENYKLAGNKVVIIANHLSFLDAVLIAYFLPEKPMFAVNSQIATKWYFKPFIRLVEAFELDPTNPMATKSMIREINKNKKCVIFPEGRITVTGSLMKIYEGPGMIAFSSGANILPIRIEGAQYTLFSRLKGKVRTRLRPKIKLTILPPQVIAAPEGLLGKKRRQFIGLKLYDLMSKMLYESSNYQITLFQSLLDQMHIHGRRHLIAEDMSRKPISYGKLIQKSMVLGSKFNKMTEVGEYVGFMLPNSLPALVTFFGLQAYGRVPAMLNFSAGLKNIKAACAAADLKTIITSRQFVEAAKLADLLVSLQSDGLTIRYLEDIKISTIDKLMAVMYWLAPESLSPPIAASLPAIILFTSGSEGLPKGVVLSNTNLQSNRYQLASRVDFGPYDKIFNALPMFHAFGLTAGTVLPILSGIKVFLYPSPLHYRVIPELIYDTNATILFGTDTFLSGYARFANAYDFYSVRYVFAGAEKLKESTRKIWSENFGVRIFEGYGATEASPVISINTPMHNRPGTVGRFLPGINYRFTEVPGITGAARLHISGLNVMLGYLYANNPGILQALENDYDTGDIVAIDSEGYVTISGRAKRFAKIAGEMVSLTAVETYVCELWPNYQNAIISVPDPKKGEAIILFTTNANATQKELISQAKALGMNELSIPKTIKIIESMPLLASGKFDYVALKSHLTFTE